MEPMTCQQICDGELEPVSSHADPSWRHGCRMTNVYHRESDNTYWEARFRLSTDGECNELREGIANISQVEPFQEMATKYRPKL